MTNENVKHANIVNALQITASYFLYFSTVSKLGCLGNHIITKHNDLTRKQIENKCSKPLWNRLNNSLSSTVCPFTLSLIARTSHPIVAPVKLNCEENYIISTAVGQEWWEEDIMETVEQKTC